MLLQPAVRLPLLTNVNMGLEIVLLAVLCMLAGRADSYKIFVNSPAYSHSHSTFMGKIAEALQDAGHEVLVYIPVFDPETHTNGTERVPVLRFDVMDDPSFFKKHPIKSDPFNENLDMLDDKNMGMFVKMFTQGCEGQFANKQILRTLRDQKFDVSIAEFYDYCPFGIAELLNIPAHIAASAVPMTDSVGDLFGVPQPLSYVPSMFGSFTDKMSYKERATNLFLSTTWRQILKRMLNVENEMLRQHHGNDLPLLEDLAKKTAVAFVNAEEFFEFPRPITHRVIYVGGIGVPKTKNLSKDLTKVVESADKGVILLSFGSIAKSTLLPMEKKLAILRTAANFPEYTFIWKYERPEEDRELFTNSSNIYPMAWVPQVDLLNHPNVKAFITHGGLNSMTEAITSGTPSVAVPLFGDQEHNVAVAAKRGVSVCVKKRNFNTDALTAALREILYNEKYAVNAKRLAGMIARKPMKPKELVVKWTEFVAEFQDLSNLDIAGRDFSFIKYFLIDIIAPAIIFVLLTLYIVVKFVLFTVRKSSSLFIVKEKQF